MRSLAFSPAWRCSVGQNVISDFICAVLSSFLINPLSRAAAQPAQSSALQPPWLPGEFLCLSELESPICGSCSSLQALLQPSLTCCLHFNCLVALLSHSILLSASLPLLTSNIPLPAVPPCPEDGGGAGPELCCPVDLAVCFDKVYPPASPLQRVPR